MKHRKTLVVVALGTVGFGAWLLIPTASAWGNGTICWQGSTYTFADEPSYYEFLSTHPGALEGTCVTTTTAPTTTTITIPESSTTSTVTTTSPSTTQPPDTSPTTSLPPEPATTAPDSTSSPTTSAAPSTPPTDGATIPVPAPSAAAPQQSGALPATR